MLINEMLSNLKSIVKPINSDETVKSFNPTKAMSDFEQAYQNALIYCFPGIKIYGCFFHFKQAIHRWVTKHSYKLILNRNAQFRIWVNMLCSLAQRESEEKFLKLKAAYIAKSLELYDYLYAVAANVELTMFIDEDGNLDPVNVLEDVVEDFNNSIVEDLENVDLNSNILDNSTYLQMREEEHEADI